MSKTTTKKRVRTPKKDDKPVGFYKKGGKTRPITRPKGKERPFEKIIRRSHLSKKEIASGAQVAELTRFLTGYLSGRPEVRVRFHGSNDLFAASDRGRVPEVYLPSWSGYELPVDGFETWRVYRQGTWHESQHLKYTPKGVYSLAPAIDGLSPKVTKTLVNIIEDRRIEDLGVEYHRGIGPERDYTQGYAYALRPKIDEIPIPESQVFEAFTQLMLIGRLNGKLPDEYQVLVDEAVEIALKYIEQMNKHPHKSKKIAEDMEKAVKEVVEKLKLKNLPKYDEDGEGEGEGEGEGQGDGPGGHPEMICEHCGENMLGRADRSDLGQRMLRSVSTGKTHKGTMSCPHCGGKNRIAVQEGEGGEGGDGSGGIPGPGGGESVAGGGGNPLEDEDGNIDIPHIDWDETFRAPKNPELAQKAKDEVEKKINEFFEKERKDAEENGRIKREDGDNDPHKTYVEDVEAAIKGTEDSRSEFDSIQRGGNEPSELKGMFSPLSDLAPVGPYLDSKFKKDMNKRLKTWRTGLSRKHETSGHALDVGAYINTKGHKKPKPFVRYNRRNVKGKKYLFVLDFSGSTSRVQNDYKKAIINTMEALDTIGAKVAVFGFGTFETAGMRTGGGFKVKTFEEGPWRGVHASKLAGVSSGGGTPTGPTYARLEKYIKKNRPQYTITLTDGSADSPDAVEVMNKKLKRHTKMVAFGIAGSEQYADTMKGYFDNVNYRKSFTVTDVKDIPKKLVDMIAPPEAR